MLFRSDKWKKEEARIDELIRSVPHPSQYTHPQPVSSPQPLKTLSDEEIVAVRKEVVCRYIRPDVVGKKYGESIAFARAIIARLQGDG